MLKVAQYQPQLFQRLESLHTAGTEFNSRQCYDILWSEFREIFEKHGQTSNFGLSLLHRHFDLYDTERLVEFNDTATPWKLSTNTNLLEGSIRPQSWLFTDNGTIVPYEFFFAPHNAEGEITLEDKEQFLMEVNQALEKHGFRHLVGIRLCPGKDYEGRVELTEGRANINLRPNQVPTSAKALEAAWFFNQPNKRVLCYCVEASRGHSHNRC